MTYLESCIDLADQFMENENLYKNGQRYIESLNKTFALTMESIDNKILNENGTYEDRMILREAAVEDTADKVTKVLDQYAKANRKLSEDINKKVSKLTKSTEYTDKLNTAKKLCSTDKNFKKSIGSFNNYSDAYKRLHGVASKILSKTRSMKVSENDLTAWRKEIDSYEINREVRTADASVSSLMKNIGTDNKRLLAELKYTELLGPSIIAMSRKISKGLDETGSIPIEITEALHLHNRAQSAAVMSLWKQFTSEVAGLFKIVDSANKSELKNQ